MSLKQELLTWNRSEALQLSEDQLQQRVETTIANTYMWMWAVLLLSFGIAYSMSLWLIPIGFSWTWYWISWIAGLGIIFWMSRSWKKLSYTMLATLLLIFGVLQWYGLAWVFFAYSMNSIYQVFLSSAVLFFVLAFVWYRTKINIARVWPLLFWSMVALFITMLLNSFLFQSPMADMWLSAIGIVIFAWFIVYDMNVLKQQALSWDRRIELLMALWLFINFVNIFLFLLRLFGRRE